MFLANLDIMASFTTAIQKNRNRGSQKILKTLHKKSLLVLISVCGFFASLSKYEKDWLKEVPSLISPIQEMRDLGRPLTLISLLIILVLSVFSFKNIRLSRIPKAFLFLSLLQAVILVKGCISGDINLSVSAFLVYSSVVLVFFASSLSLLNTVQDITLSILAIVGVGFIFILVNLCQASVDIYPITFANGYLMGTTGNAQHAGMLLVINLPCLLFLIIKSPSMLHRVLWSALVCMIFVALAMTSSRTAAISGVIGIVLFFRHKIIHTLLAMTFITSFQLFLFPTISNILNLSLKSSTDKGLSDTRGDVWNSQISGFLEHPIFGVPLDGGRVPFAESSWLGVAYGTGLIGLVVLVLFAYSCIRMAIKLHVISSKFPIVKSECDTVISGIALLLAGSFSEAYLVGVLTFTIFALIQYLLIGQYIISLHKRRILHKESL